VFDVGSYVENAGSRLRRRRIEGLLALFDDAVDFATRMSSCIQEKDISDSTPDRRHLTRNRVKFPASPQS
jgi:hypothetical protein